MEYMLKITLLFLLNTLLIFSQSSGSVSGKVVEKSTGEGIPGVNIIIKDLGTGTSSDLNGMFSIRGITAGRYNITFSSVGFKTTIAENVVITQNTNTELNIALESVTYETDEVVVTATASMAYEEALLNQQKNSNNVSDALSIEQIKKAPDATTAEALKRVPGITLYNDKFLYVRGVSERYSGALLNSSVLPSSEPDKKSFSFDLIPSNLIENVVVYKTFTPDNPGDFASGLISVNTVDFPTERNLSFSYSNSFIDGVTTRSGYSYEGGKSDFTGINDGSRDLPPGFPEDISKFSFNRDTVYQLAKTLPNNWKINSRKVPVNLSAALTYADIFRVFGNDLGLVSSLSYRTSNGSHQITTREIVGDGSYKFDYTGTESVSNYFTGGILNLSYRVGSNFKFSLKNLVSLITEDETTFLQGSQFDKSQEQRNYSLRFVSRELYTSNLSAEILFPWFYNSSLNLRATYANSKRDEPDYRRYYYARSLGTDEKYYISLSLQPTLGLGGRYYSELNEDIRQFSVDFSVPDLIGEMKIKTGLNYKNSSRSFSSRLIGIVSQLTTSFSFLFYDIDSVFRPENFYSRGFTIAEYLDGANKYSSDDENFASYFMMELPFSILGGDFKIIWGARNEVYSLRLNTFNIDGTQPVRVRGLSSDLLPSVNLIYRITPFSNIRIGYSKTINRPEFREVAPFSYYNFQTQSIVTGNPELKQGIIQNYDLRFEVFPDLGEIFSVSLFYKEIQDAIESAAVPTSGDVNHTFVNAPKAENYGIELEFRSSLGYISKYLNHFFINTNLTIVKSKINETQIGLNRGERPLQGQSPYVVNASLNYLNSDIGLSVTLLYNEFGRRITEVATYYSTDIYEEGRGQSDLSISKKLTDYLDLKLSIKDLLGKPTEITQDDKLIRSFERRAVYSLGISIKI